MTPFVPGDRVKYSQAFLKDECHITRRNLPKRGVVTNVRIKATDCVMVKWDTRYRNETISVRFLEKVTNE